MKVRYTVLDGEIVSENRGGVQRDYVPDPLGSTVTLLDASQAKTDTFEYWPYGEQRVRTGATPTPFRFVGTLGYFADSGSRTYVRRRNLSLTLGSWYSLDDPSYLPDSLYAVSDNNPTTKVDLTGERPEPRLRASSKPTTWDTLKKNCLKNDTTSLLEKSLKNKKCADLIKKRCGKPFSEMVNGIKWIVGECPGNMPGCTKMEGQPDPRKPGKCMPLHICIDKEACNRKSLPGFDPVQLLIDVIFFELGNYCSCLNKNKRDPGETWAQEFAEACSPMRKP